MREIKRRVPRGKSPLWLTSAVTNPANPAEAGDDSEPRLLPRNCPIEDLQSFGGSGKALLPLTTEWLSEEAVHALLLHYLPGGYDLDPALLDSLAVSEAPDFKTLFKHSAAGFLVRVRNSGTEKTPLEYFGTRFILL